MNILPTTAKATETKSLVRFTPAYESHVLEYHIDMDHAVGGCQEWYKTRPRDTDNA